MNKNRNNGTSLQTCAIGKNFVDLVHKVEN